MAASITISASFLSTTSLASQSPVTVRRSLVIANAARGSAETEVVKLSCEAKRESSNGRRELVFAAAAAAATAACAVAGIAVAEEPKRGTADAKKFYAPVCVTMPTARICHK